jgi:hypothetical protein
MGLFGLAPATIKPTALLLNLLVSSVMAVHFGRAGQFSWPLLRPFLRGRAPDLGHVVPPSAPVAMAAGG